MPGSTKPPPLPRYMQPPAPLAQETGSTPVGGETRLNHQAAGDVSGSGSAATATGDGDQVAANEGAGVEAPAAAHAAPSSSAAAGTAATTANDVSSAVNAAQFAAPATTGAAAEATDGGGSPLVPAAGAPTAVAGVDRSGRLDLADRLWAQKAAGVRWTAPTRKRQHGGARATAVVDGKRRLGWRVVQMPTQAYLLATTPRVSSSSRSAATAPMTSAPASSRAMMMMETTTFSSRHKKGRMWGSKDEGLHRVCAICGRDKMKDEYTLNQWRNRGAEARCIDCSRGGVIRPPPSG
eukprot:SAG25_NODE_190_length_12277_cov_10.004927_10_plen_294_part_00